MLRQTYCHKAICVFIFVSVLVFNSLAQSINRIEYFIDTDPGFGNATTVSFTANDTVANLTFAANTSGLSNGLHTLYARSKDHNNFWSLTKSVVFVKSGINTPLQNIVQIEYFFDSDPGFGSAAQVSITPSTTISNFTFPANTAALNGGLHTLYIRSKDANGIWSLTNKHSFVKSYVTNPTVNIVKAEYFVDTDPGFGGGIDIPLTPNTTITSLNFNANVDTIKSGLHTIYIRTKDANGNWSLTNRHSFIRVTNVSPLANIVKAEYYIDTDPGIGSAINIPISSPAANLSSMTFSVDLTSVNNGLHTIYIRTRDANGNWSLTNRHSFYKDQTLTNENIVAVEYFVDNDPGVGNATVAPLTPASNLVAQSFVANLTAFSNGPHTLYVRSKNVNGDWSLTNGVNFNKAFIAPVANFTASVTSGCAPLTVNFTDISQNSPTTWAWDFDNNGTTDATTQNPNYTFNTPGNYSVKLTVSNVSGNNTLTKTGYINVISNYNTNTSTTICLGDSAYLQGEYRKIAGLYHDTLISTSGCDSIIHTTLSINPLNTPSISINSNLTSACDNGLIAFNSSVSNGGASPIYQWQVNGNTISGNLSSISLSSLNDNDIVSCILTSNVSCPSKTKDTSNFISINILPTSGNSITASACNSYTLNSITYNASGVYTQIFTNAVGCDSILTLNLTIKNNSYITKYYTRCLGDTVYEGANAYYQTGLYDNYYTAANGCDSVVTVDLVIIDLDNSTYISGPSIYTNELLVTYQWFNCGMNTIIPGATNDYYTPTANGSYYVVLNYGGCYDTSACVNFTTVGINNFSSLDNIKVIPNPNSGVFTLMTGLLPNESFDLIITDLLGKQIESYTLRGSKINLQLSHLSAGAYLINIKTSNKAFTTKLIIEY